MCGGLGLNLQIRPPYNEAILSGMSTNQLKWLSQCVCVGGVTNTIHEGPLLTQQRCAFSTYLLIFSYSTFSDKPHRCCIRRYSPLDLCIIRI